MERSVRKLTVCPQAYFSRVKQILNTVVSILALAAYSGCDRSAQVRRPAPNQLAREIVSPATTTTHTVADTGIVPPLADSLIRAAAAITGTFERIDFFSRALLGAPYDSVGPTGEGRSGAYDTAPLWNFDAFDCVTYIEHVLALALASTPGDFLPELLALRYRGGAVGYETRNHFFYADWMSANARLLEIQPPPNPHRVSRTVSRRAFFARKGIDTVVADTVLALELWTVERLTEALAQGSLARGAYLVAFVKKGWRFIDVNHAGVMLVERPGIALFRDSSRLRKRSAQRDMAQYLAGQKDFLDGMILAKTGTD